MNKLIAGGLLLASQFIAPIVHAQPAKPTVVLVHGAFADSSSWNGVITILQRDGYKVVAAANPLRGVRADADAVADVVKGIDGPVVLVGHSYGGSVISEAAEGRPNVKALVYVAAFAPEAGETAIGLTGKFPGSTLGGALAPPVKLTSGGSDLYIDQSRFPQQFAADVPASQARLMAADQRPVPSRLCRKLRRRRPGRACRPGSFMARKTRTSRPLRWASWPNAPSRARRWRSKVRRMS